MFNKFDIWQANNQHCVEEEFEEAKNVSVSKHLFDIEIGSQLQMAKSHTRSSQVGVVETEALTTKDREKVHMKVQLPDGVYYKGEYLEHVLFNSKSQVDRSRVCSAVLVMQYLRSDREDRQPYLSEFLSLHIRYLDHILSSINRSQSRLV